MAAEARGLPLTLDELREVAAFAAQCAEEVLPLFEAAHPEDARPRQAIAEAWTFARGGKRGKALRDAAWGAMRAAKDAQAPAAAEAARAAMAAAGAAYLHPLADAHQVKHILGSAAYSARAQELAAGGEGAAALASLEGARRRASPVVVAVLARYPAAPAGGGRLGALVRELDAALRRRP
ncbi:MAG TPA: exonuclease SbcC [Candidatus Thermoplasmatota archaeon]|nr:exonuclease SbcC [Candidatus Thermoplasmatota archaeon]